MEYYPGGSFTQPFLDKYTWQYNTFSDLGLWHTPSGEKSNVSPILFMLAAFILSIAQFISCNNITHRLQTNKFNHTIKIIGCLSAISIVFISTSPHNRYPNLHLFFVVLWLLSLFIFSLKINFKLHNQFNSTLVRFTSLILATLIFLHTAQYFFNLSPFPSWIILQKYVVYAMIAFFVVIEVYIYRNSTL